MTTTDKAKVLDRVKKILAHAESAQSFGSIAEAEHYFKMVQKLLNESGLTRGDLLTEQVTHRKLDFVLTFEFVSWKVDLASIISEMAGVELIFHSTYKNCTITALGYEQDIQVFEFLFGKSLALVKGIADFEWGNEIKQYDNLFKVLAPENDKEKAQRLLKTEIIDFCYDLLTDGSVKGSKGKFFADLLKKFTAPNSEKLILCNPKKWTQTDALTEWTVSITGLEKLGFVNRNSFYSSILKGCIYGIIKQIRVEKEKQREHEMQSAPTNEGSSEFLPVSIQKEREIEKYMKETFKNLGTRSSSQSSILQNDLLMKGMAYGKDLNLNSKAIGDIKLIG